MKLNLNVGHCIGKFFAACFQVSQVKKRQERIKNACGAFSTTEVLEDRHMMTVDPVAAIVAPESDYIVTNSMIVDVQHEASNDDIFASLAAEPLTPKEVRQGERQERKEARQAQHDLNNLFAPIDASADAGVPAQARKLVADNSGVQISVSPRGDGENDGGTEVFASQTFTVSRSKYLVSGATLNIEGHIEGIISATVSLNGTPIQTVAVTSHTVNFEGFSAGPVGKTRKTGPLTLEYSFTVASNATQEHIHVSFVSNALRRWNKGIKFNTPVRQNGMDLTIGNGGGSHGTNPGIIITQTDGTTIVPEGGTDIFTVKLDAPPPNDNYVVTLNPSDFGAVTLSTYSLTFNRSNYATPQSVTVFGVEDQDTNNDSFFITATSAHDTESFNGTVTDNDVVVGPAPQLITTETGGSTVVKETGGSEAQDTILYRLSAQPTGNVVVTVTSTDTTSGTVGPMTLTFTPGNWNTDQVVTVTGVPDADQQNDTFTVQATSSVGNSNVGVTVIDVTPNEVSWDAVQIYFVNAVKLISISGFNAVFAGEEMQIVADLNHDGNATEPISPIFMGDSNGGFIGTPVPNAYQLTAGTSVQVRFWDPAGQGFNNANGISVHYLDAAGNLHEVGVNSPEVTLQGPALIIS